MKKKIVALVLALSMVVGGISPVMTAYATDIEQPEDTSGEDGDVIEGEDGDVTEGEDGDVIEGEDGDVTEGEEGDVTEGEGGDVTEGEEGDVTEGEEGDVTEGEGGDVTEGEGGDVTEGEEGEVVETDYEVILPEGYEESSKMYPVVFVLPENGYEGDGGVVEKLVDAMDNSIAMDMILVTPKFSEGMDLYAVMDAIVAEVDAEYRTISDKQQRAVVGTGVGGYLAYILALKDGETILSAPKNYYSMVSIRGDFSSEKNPWVGTYGAVSGLTTQSRLGSFYAYLDAPARDEYTNDAGSTNDIGKPLLSYQNYDHFEFTVRSGEFTDAFLTESVNRVSDRLATRFQAGLTTGSLSLVEPALEADVAKATVNYEVKVADTFSKFISGTSDMDIYASVIDPSTNEILAESVETVSVSGADTFTGTLEVDNIVNGDFSYVKLYADLVGVKAELGAVQLSRLAAATNDKIDLMSEWYFNYTGTSNTNYRNGIPASTYTTWHKVVPGLGNWEPGYGNISPTANNMSLPGSGWYVKEFYVPEGFEKDDIIAYIGNIDDRGEAWINGTRIGATGLDDSGNSNCETSWAVVNEYEVDSSVLKYGETNTIIVRAVNDSMGAGGWYAGPIAIYSRKGYNEMKEVPSGIVSEDEKAKVIAAVEAQNELLASGDYEGYAATVYDEYFNSGVFKADVVASTENQYQASVESIVDTDVQVFGKEADGKQVYWYSAKRSVDGADAVDFAEYYADVDGDILQYGDHSRFFETSYMSSWANGSATANPVEERYLVYLPESYFSSDRYYPMGFLMHQYNSDHTSYRSDNVNLLFDEGAREGMFDEMVVVIPNSSENSWWATKWQNMITQEMLPMFTENYRTVNDARYRVTAGCSMGGYGSFAVALMNPDYFSGAISFFGGINYSNPTATTIANNESVEYLENFALYFNCGNHDFYNFGQPAIELNKILEKKGVEHEFFIDNGEHNSLFYVPTFKDAFAYARGQMYKSNAAMEELLSGEVSVENGVLTANFAALDGIEDYFNVIPASSYTKDSNPDLYIPLIVEVEQDGKLVLKESVNTHFINEEDKAETLTVDLTKKVDLTKDYEVTFKAAILDRMVELKSAEIEGGEAPVDPPVVPELTYAALEEAIAAAKALDKEAYTEESYAALEEAVAAAEALLNNAETQEAIDEAVAAIEAAVEALEEAEEPVAVEVLDIVVNTEVTIAGQYPMSIDVEVADAAALADAKAEDFAAAGQAAGWLTSSLHDFTATFKEVSIDGNVVTLTFDNFPERYPYVDNYTVTYNGNVIFTFDVTKETKTVTPIADEFEQVRGDFNYNLFTPEDTSKAQPIVLAFHGFGDDENLYHNRLATAWADPANQADRPAYVLAPMFGGYSMYSKAGREAVYVNVYNKVQQMIADGQVDPSRVYVTGKSYGGGAVYEFLEKYPEFAAGAIAMCGQSTSPFGDVQANLDKIVDIPLWIAHATTDPTVKVSCSQDVYAKLVDLGSTVVKYTEYSDEEMTAAGVTPAMSNHSMEAVVLEDVAYMEWLFAQVNVPTDVEDIFSDVLGDYWYTDAIQYVYDNEIMTGNEDGTFAPEVDMTRAMMVTTLYRIEGSPEVEEQTALAKFTDAEEGMYYVDALSWAADNGIAKGYDYQTIFGIDHNVTREQVATFLYRYAQFKEYDVNITADISEYVGAEDVSEYAQEAMEWAVGAGLISGIDKWVDGEQIFDLAPQGNATRAQLATILMRFCERY